MTKFSTTLKCDYFPQCSGCDDQERVLSPSCWKGILTFFEKCAPSLSIPLINKEIVGWRLRSKLAVRGTETHPDIGLFKRGSHDVVAIPTCPLHHPAINRATALIRNQMIVRKISPYSEQSGKGIVRYLQCIVERRTRLVQLTLVLNLPRRDPSIEHFVKQLYTEGGFHSIWLNYQPGSTNAILSDQWQLCEGESYIEQKINGYSFFFHPACFMQAHLSLFEELLRTIQQEILPNKKVVDLYAGVGVIGVNVVEKSARVVCVESNPFAQPCFQLSRLKLTPEQQKKVSFTQGQAEHFLQALSEAEVVIVDPPRKGLDPTVLQALQSCKAEQLIYVSCNPISFQRDCSALIGSGWRITKAQGYLLFPGSDNVEILCVFVR